MPPAGNLVAVTIGIDWPLEPFRHVETASIARRRHGLCRLQATSARTANEKDLIVFPDTRELVVQDFRDLEFTRRSGFRRLFRRAVQSLGRCAAVRRYPVIGRDSLVVLDLDTGEERGRVGVPSPSQAFLFPAPGFNRDLYYLSMTSMARVTVEREAPAVA